MTKIKFLIPIIVLLIGLNGCYYDNVEHLYPSGGDCDTTNVTYSNDVWPIINSNCTSCHSGAAASGNVRLEDYAQIKASADNGSLLGVIKHEPSWSPMPKGGAKFSDCSILTIENWISQGAPNN